MTAMTRRVIDPCLTARRLSFGHDSGAVLAHPTPIAHSKQDLISLTMPGANYMGGKRRANTGQQL